MLVTWMLSKSFGKRSETYLAILRTRSDPGNTEQASAIRSRHAGTRVLDQQLTEPSESRVSTVTFSQGWLYAGEIFVL